MSDRRCEYRKRILSGLAHSCWLTVVALTTVVRAQPQHNPDPIHISVQASREYRSHAGGISVNPSSSDCGVFGSSQMNTTQVGVGLEAPELLGSVWGLGGRLTWRWGSEVYRYQAGALPYFDAEIHQQVDISHELRLTTPQSDVLLDAYSRFRVLPWLSVLGGPSVTVRFPGTVIWSDVSTDPVYRLPNGARDSVLPARSDLSVQKFGLGGIIGLSASMPLGRSAAVSVEGVARFESTAPFAQAPQFNVGAGVGVSLSWNLFSPLLPSEPLPPSPKDSLPRVETLAVPVAQAPSLPSVSIHISGVDASGASLPYATMNVYETSYEQTIEPTRLIEFAHKSTVLGDRNTLLDAERAFTYDAIAVLSLAEIERQQLNILGARLRSDASLRLELVGVASPGEPSSLATERERVVRRYLESVWMIDSARISIRSLSDVSANRELRDAVASKSSGVYIVGDDRLTSPLSLHRVVRDVEAPTISLDPSYAAAAGVRSWSLTFRLNGQQIARHTSSDTDDLSHIQWRLDDDVSDQKKRRLIVEFSVEDSVGQTATAFDSLELDIATFARVVQRHSSMRGDSSWSVSTLFGSGCEVFDGDRRNAAALESALRDADLSATVIVAYRVDGARCGVDVTQRQAKAIVDALRHIAASRSQSGVKFLMSELRALHTTPIDLLNRDDGPDVEVIIRR